MDPKQVNTAYKIFISNFRNSRFTACGSMMFDILSMLLKDSSLPPSWQQELPELVAFLHNMGFSFDTADEFYEMLATVALRIKKDPRANWRSVLDTSLTA